MLNFKYKNARCWLSLAVVMVLCGCGGIRTRSEVAHLKSPSRVFETNIEIEEILPSALVAPPASKTVETPIVEKKRIPMVANAHVEKWIQYFTVKDRERFQRFLDRGQKYREVVETVLEENDLPAELYYLAMIESGYRVEALSHAKAKGVWQFIPGTATRYGLRVDQFTDERQDPIRSTEAAAKYLRDLYNVFGSWPLAMAGYNAGEIRVLRSVFKGKTRDFWKLVEQKALPTETAEYVPKFLAVVLIGMNPEKYGFTDPSSTASYPSVESVEVPGLLSLSEIAKASDIPLQKLREVNPHLSRRTPPGSYDLWVQSDYVKAARQSQPKLAALAKSGARRTVATMAPVKKSIHIVRRGENLSTIARRYKISVGHLKRMNQLKQNRIFVGAKLHVRPRAYRPSKVVRYKVKRGDNLTFIAKKFKTTVTRLRTLNKLKKNRIVVGQVIKLRAYPL